MTQRRLGTLLLEHAYQMSQKDTLLRKSCRWNEIDAARIYGRTSIFGREAGVSI